MANFQSLANWHVKIAVRSNRVSAERMSVTFDIALAAAVLWAHGKSAWGRLEKTVLLGELALDGRVRPVKGVLSAVLAAKREG